MNEELIEKPPQQAEQKDSVVEPVPSAETEVSDREIRETQKVGIRQWAERQVPLLKEGVDFMFIGIEEAAQPGDTIAPHETGSIYFGYLTKHFEKFDAMFSGEYAQVVAKHKKDWTNEVGKNYSWAGRYMVTGGGGVAIDSAPIESVKPPSCKSHHGEFRKYFQEQTGFELPTAGELDEIVMKMAENIGWYQEVRKRLEEERDKKAPGERWAFTVPINSIDYALIILGDAAALSEELKSAERMRDFGSSEGEQKAVELAKKHQLAELPEEFWYMNAKIRQFNDLTYNADDWVDLDEINKNLLGGTLPPPTEKGARIDKIYEDYYGFDRERMEQLCKGFSDKLYKPKK